MKKKTLKKKKKKLTTKLKKDLFAEMTSLMALSDALQDEYLPEVPGFARRAPAQGAHSFSSRMQMNSKIPSKSDLLGSQGKVERPSAEAFLRGMMIEEDPPEDFDFEAELRRQEQL
jgi:hypothetical protein